MTSLRDTSADEAANVHQRFAPGDGDLPLTLTGRERWTVHRALLNTCAMLQQLEKQARREPRVQARIRAQRIEIERALALVPEARPESVPEAPLQTVANVTARNSAPQL